MNTIHYGGEFVLLARLVIRDKMDSGEFVPIASFARQLLNYAPSIEVSCRGRNFGLTFVTNRSNSPALSGPMAEW